MSDLEALLLRAFVSALDQALPPIVERAISEALPEALRRATLPEHTTREGASHMLGVSVSTVDGMLRARKLTKIKRGSRVLIRTDEVLELLSEATVPKSS